MSQESDAKVETNTPSPEASSENSGAQTPTPEQSSGELKQEGNETPNNFTSSRQEVGNKQKPQAAPRDDKPTPEAQAQESGDTDAAQANSKPENSKEETKSTEDLGWSDIKDMFSSEVNLFTELGIGESLVADAMDGQGNLDVSKLGELAPRDAAVVKTAAENMYRQRIQQGKEIRQSYEEAVGGASHYKAMADWAKEQTKSNPDGELTQYMNEVGELLANGGHAAKAVVRELYGRFRDAAGTNVHARIARAAETADHGDTPLTAQGRRDVLQETLRKHGGGTVQKGQPSNRLKQLKGY